MTSPATSATSSTDSQSLTGHVNGTHVVLRVKNKDSVDTLYGTLGPSTLELTYPTVRTDCCGQGDTSESFHLATVAQFNAAPKQMTGNDEADEKAGTIRGAELGRQLSELGIPLSSKLAANIQKLAGHKNSLAHYLPTVRPVTVDLEDGSQVTTFERSPVVRTETHVKWAQHAIATMLDLWSSPITDA